MLSSYLAYFAAKFACKVQIQTFSFAAPVTAVLPAAFLILVTMCGAKAKDQCAFETK